MSAVVTRVPAHPDAAGQQLVLLEPIAAADAREEERHARARQRRMERLQVAARRARERAWRERLRQAATETASKWPGCRCSFDAIESWEQLQALGGGCSMPAWCCARLDAVRRRVAGPASEQEAVSRV